MQVSEYRLRRATLDDLATLRPLWESMRLPVEDLDKRLTEFQVVETREGQIAGVIGFRMLHGQGWLHSEAFADFSVADTVRPLIWERIKTLSSNHGVLRLWTQESAPFWSRNGFQSASTEALKKLPEPWRESNGKWLTLQLKNEEAIASLDKELAMFMEAERRRTARAFERARVLKFIAMLVAVVFAVFVIGAIIYLARKNPGLLTPSR